LQRVDVGDRTDLVTVLQSTAQIVVEPVLGALADPDHGRANLGECPYEPVLVGRKRLLDEDDVHNHAP